MTDTALTSLLKQVRTCELCANNLPLGPRPVVQIAASARIMIIGQAPGLKVHKTGKPWNDPSGVRRRECLNLSADELSDDNKVAIMSMGFCCPGRGHSGDLPPRPDGAAQWHNQLLQ